MKNLILIITFSLSSMIYAQKPSDYEKPTGYLNDEGNIVWYGEGDIDLYEGDTISIYDTVYYDNGSIEYFTEGKMLVDTLEGFSGDIYYYNPHNQLEYIAHFNQGELLGHTVYEPLKPEDYE